MGTASTHPRARTESRAGTVPGTGYILRGVVGGLFAGAIFIALNAWFAYSMGDPAEGPLAMISTIALGQDAMAEGAANPTVGAVVHVLLSVAYGVIFAFLAAQLRSNGARAVAGTLFGAGLYLLNFLVLSPLAFPVFQNANQPFEFVAHVVFGVALAFAFYERHTVRRPAAATSR